MIEQCKVIALAFESASYSSGALTDCSGAPGMSAGIFFNRDSTGKLVAKGFLVALEYARNRDSKEEKLIGVHALMFDAKFTAWLKGDCAFWPAALRIHFCGVRF